jgi:hypothetical protein
MIIVILEGAIKTSQRCFLVYELRVIFHGRIFFRTAFKEVLKF